MVEDDEPRQWIISLFYYQELTYVLWFAGLQNEDDNRFKFGGLL